MATSSACCSGYRGTRLAGEELWEAANHLLDAKRPGDFNQAMMELGAVVCTPRAPACLTCPVVELCVTRGEIAPTAKPAQQKKREIHYALDRRNGEVFLIRRPPDASLMPGMWELPELPSTNGTGIIILHAAPFDHSDGLHRTRVACRRAIARRREMDFSGVPQAGGAHGPLTQDSAESGNAVRDSSRLAGN